MTFKFEKQERVLLPRSVVQAVVMDCIESVPGCPVYDVRWLTDEGELMTGRIGEGDLAQIWAPAPAPAEHLSTEHRPAVLRVPAELRPAAVAKRIRNRRRNRKR